MSAPFYWMYETSGVLRPEIEAYLHGGPMTVSQIAAMLARTCASGSPRRGTGPGSTRCGGAFDELTSREAIARWLDDALEETIDPL